VDADVRIPEGTHIVITLKQRLTHHRELIMQTHRNTHRTRFLAIVPLAVLLAGACKTDSNGPSSPPLSADHALSFSSVSLAAPAASPLGLAANFAALGGAGVTCTSPNPALPAITISGNVGSLLTAPSSVTGFPGFTPGALPCSLSGTVQLGAAAADADFLTEYNTLAAIPCPTDAPHLLSGDLGGMDLAPGIYCISGVGLLTSQLTLRGGANEIWIFKAASSITPIGGSVVMAGGGNACNVYWQLGTAASFDNTTFVGNVLAGSAITFTGIGSSLAGRALAQTDVTLTGASITGCVGGSGNGNGGGDDDGNDDGDHGQGDRDHHDKDKHHEKDKDHDKDKDGGHNHGSDSEHGNRNGRDN
jgi:hypothetical protein